MLRLVRRIKQAKRCKISHEALDEAMRNSMLGMNIG